MINYRKIAVAASLLLFGAAGCADLAVTNVNDPERDRALADAGDVESLIAGSYRQWWLGQQSDDSNDFSSPGLFLAAAAFEWSSTAANFGILQYSRIPREPVQNSSTHADYGHFATAWTRNYRAIASASEGLRAFTANPNLGKDLGAGDTTSNRRANIRTKIFSRFVQGLGHGSIALLYDRGYVVDEKVQVVDESGAPVLLGEPVPYTQVMNASIGYLTEAINLATSPQAAGVTIPSSWMTATADVTMPELVRLMYSMRARFRANVARTPAERAAVNWAAVLQDTERSIKTDWLDDRSFAYNQWLPSVGHIYYPATSTFGQSTLFGIGMADTSGVFQQWLAQPVSDRTQLLNGQQVLIHTPDNRFPKGATLAAQTAAPGRYYGARGNNQFTRPERGSWRWSYYFQRQITLGANGTFGVWPLMRGAEIRLLAAEGLFRTGQLQAAADSINVSRVASGLNATNAAGLNTRCVPRLPNGSCGNLFEMLKWEKRMETFLTGPYLSTWYFDGRGWGDLYRGTPLQFPIPDEQAQVLGLGAAYTFGGVGGQFASPGSTYNFPGE